jgi:hypothetical protein
MVKDKRQITDALLRFGNVKLFLGLDNHYLFQSVKKNTVTYSHGSFIVGTFISEGLIQNVTPKKRHHIYVLTAKGKKLEQLLVKIGEQGMSWKDGLRLKLQGWYEKHNTEWKASDEFLFWGATTLLPILIWIPLLYMALRWLFIDYMYVHYGFDKTIIYIAIILMIRPIISDLFKMIAEKAFK